MTRVALWPPIELRARDPTLMALLDSSPFQPAVMHKRRDRECLEFLQISPAAQQTDVSWLFPWLFERHVFAWKVIIQTS